MAHKIMMTKPTFNEEGANAKKYSVYIITVGMMLVIFGSFIFYHGVIRAIFNVLGVFFFIGIVMFIFGIIFILSAKAIRVRKIIASCMCFYIGIVCCWLLIYILEKMSIAYLNLTIAAEAAGMTDYTPYIIRLEFVKICLIVMICICLCFGIILAISHVISRKPTSAHPSLSP